MARLSPAEKIEARVLAEEMLLRRVTEPTIESTLMSHYAIKRPAARRILQQAIKAIQESVESARVYRRAQAIAGLDRLYETAVKAGKLQVALGVQKQLALMEGTNKPLVVRHDMPAAGQSAGDEEYEGRTLDEIEYMAEHGHWPEEAPEEPEGEAGPATPEFPLH